MRRDVVSYVRRGDRMNPSQQRAWDGLQQYVVDIERGERRTSVGPGAQVDWVAEFGREAPLIVEIGTGTGESIAAMAAARPEANVVGFEVFLPGLASSLSRIQRDCVANVRFVVADGQQGLAQLFGDGSVSELWTWFPDPWHKKRHHKRRLVNAAFAQVVARKLVPGGHWLLATDWEDYALWMREILDRVLVNDYAGWAPRPDRPVTKFERRGIDAGREIFELSYSVGPQGHPCGVHGTASQDPGTSPG
jgi:tRNA (guanine-N7-)-methyltransferase